MSKLLLFTTILLLFTIGTWANTEHLTGPSICAHNLSISSPFTTALTRFASKMGLSDTTAFWKTSAYIQSHGHLPPCYITKSKAKSMGWSPGSNLWAVAPGDSIGGDVFSNRQGILPSGHSYVELDLDYAGGHRGGSRMVYAKDQTGNWLQWVSVDHYASFKQVTF
eukprot:TRINITY_DN109_c1_g1_i1.p1 TRINITY_DN109_c1_g1~~TRINITY_DN109_c1_g1_i1.p1  ORF type:complete len:181 (+),score=12.65 TRINITY_DN109_c1_g1_i1:48-545(+)